MRLLFGFCSACAEPVFSFLSLLQSCSLRECLVLESPLSLSSSLQLPFFLEDMLCFFFKFPTLLQCFSCSLPIFLRCVLRGSSISPPNTSPPLSSLQVTDWANSQFVLNNPFVKWCPRNGCDKAVKYTKAGMGVALPIVGAIVTSVR